ncbi:MAG: hypothetical protein JWN70_6341 [Planctomycetaceae bacterium]|nr:hypothetical protein [Planctomycetaceae bacterium]
MSSENSTSVAEKLSGEYSNVTLVPVKSIDFSLIHCVPRVAIFTMSLSQFYLTMPDDHGVASEHFQSHVAIAAAGDDFTSDWQEDTARLGAGLPAFSLG